MTSFCYMISAQNRNYSKAREQYKAFKRASFNYSSYSNIFAFSEQSNKNQDRHPVFALKNNLLYDAILLPNIELEFYMGKRWSLNLDYQCAWWSFGKSDRYYQLMSASPEVRFWLCRDSKFNGHFFGLYVGAGYYDLKYGEVGYQGEFYVAAGISYGYYLSIRPAFGMEFSLGIGYMQTQYEKYRRYDPQGDHYTFYGKDKTSYIGPTKAKVSLVWRLGNKNRNTVQR